MECSEAREHLSAFEQQTPPVAELSSHLQGCEECRRERARYQELLAAMGELERAPLEPPVWLLASVTETTLERLRRRAAIAATRKQIGDHRVAAGGILLAGVAGAVFFGRSRRRSRRLKLAGLAGAKAAA